MKAILTRYLPPTETRGSRIVATAEGGHRLTVPYDYSGQEHEAAVIALCAKLDWHGTLVSGGLPDGSTCWVFTSGEGLTV